MTSPGGSQGEKFGWWPLERASARILRRLDKVIIVQKDVVSLPGMTRPMGALVVWAACLSLVLATVLAADPGTNVTIVHVVFGNHLDVGFAGVDPLIGTDSNVIDAYFHQHFPKAVRVARKLRKQAGSERLVYTTHARLVLFVIELLGSDILFDLVDNNVLGQCSKIRNNGFNNGSKPVNVLACQSPNNNMPSPMPPFHIKLSTGVAAVALSRLPAATGHPLPQRGAGAGRGGRDPRRGHCLARLSAQRADRAV